MVNKGKCAKSLGVRYPGPPNFLQWHLIFVGREWYLFHVTPLQHGIL